MGQMVGVDGYFFKVWVEACAVPVSGIGMEADDLQCRNIVIRPTDTAPVFVQKCLWQAAQRVAGYIEMA